MVLKIKVLLIYYKKHILVLTLVSLILLLKEKESPLFFILTLKFLYFLFQKIWLEFTSFMNIEVSFKDQFLLYKNLGIHNMYLFIGALLTDSILSIIIFQIFQYFK